ERLFGNRQRPEPLIAGHRGFGKLKTPAENTAPSFEAAIAAGVHSIETDVLVSADGVPFIAHGPTGELAGRPDLLLSDLTFEEVRRLDFTHYTRAAAGAEGGRTR